MEAQQPYQDLQAGFNGRSGGYIVLYKGFSEPDTHTKTVCNHCGISTGYAEEMPCKVSGCSGTLKKISRPMYLMAHSLERALIWMKIQRK